MSVNTHTEYRVFGPPGTGKTTKLAQMIGQATEKVGAEKIMAASFTKAAAFEIAGRDLPIPEEQIGTLHSLAYGTLGKPLMIQKDKFFKEWNECHPDYYIDCADRDMDDPDDGIGKGLGAELLGRMEIYRAQMTPELLWDDETRTFAALWSDWKAAKGGIDYTDMIELALRDINSAPGNPAIGFFDECQDFSALELALVRKWAAQMQYVVLAGDDDQSIYGFRGATPDAFLNPPVDDQHKILLQQSYRVPAEIYAFANRWIRQVQYREDKEYTPRESSGSIRTLSCATFNYPEPVVEEIAETLSSGKTIMILTTCGYMLKPIIQVLRDAWLLFHNPYKPKMGLWNPLGVRGKDRATTADRVLAYAAPRDTEELMTWTKREIDLWVDLIKIQGLWTKSGRQILSLLDKRTRIPLDQMVTLMDEETVLDLESKNYPLKWLSARALSKHRDKLEYLEGLVEVRGLEVLRRKPQIIVGTIHSVKGGEADVVYLFPDFSHAAGASMMTGESEEADAMTRQFYVGMTRAKSDLILCAPVNPDQAVDLEAWL